MLDVLHLSSLMQMHFASWLHLGALCTLLAKGSPDADAFCILVHFAPYLSRALLMQMHFASSMVHFAPYLPRALLMQMHVASSMVHFAPCWPRAGLFLFKPGAIPKHMVMVIN